MLKLNENLGEENYPLFMDTIENPSDLINFHHNWAYVKQLRVTLIEQTAFDAANARVDPIILSKHLSIHVFLVMSVKVPKRVFTVMPD